MFGQLKLNFFEIVVHINDVARALMNLTVECLHNILKKKKKRKKKRQSVNV